MSKEIEVVNEAGETVKETVYTVEDMAAKDGEYAAAQTELTELRRLNTERSQNFTAYSKMSEEEKKVYDANTTTLLKREEALTNQLAEVTNKLSEKDKRDAESSKTTVLNSIHHGDENSKKLLEEKYALLSAMPETTQQEISARASEAAKLAGIQIDPRNPIYTAINGEAPNFKPNSEYVDTPEGKTALDMARAAMNLPIPK